MRYSTAIAASKVRARADLHLAQRDRLAGRRLLRQRGERLLRAAPIRCPAARSTPNRIAPAIQTRERRRDPLALRDQQRRRWSLRKTRKDLLERTFVARQRLLEIRAGPSLGV